MSSIDTIVIGASGPIGQASLELLNRDGKCAVGVSRSSAISVDVGNQIEVLNLFKKFRPQHVIYLAGPKAKELESHPEKSRLALSALERTANAAIDAGVGKFVFASSAAVYGTSNQEPRRENSPLEGSGYYAELKIQSEEKLIDLFAEFSSCLNILRIFNVYGPGCNDSLINQLAQTDTIVWDTERFVRDYIYVSDVAEAIVAAANYSGLSKVFNVGTGIGTSNAQLLNSVKSWSPVRHVPLTQSESYSVAETKFSKLELTFTARINLYEQLQQRALESSQVTNFEIDENLL